MSGSRNSLKKVGTFNPRAANEWSKDNSKFGQRMLEKMGWKKGEGIGLNNQGISENIKVRLKLDSKGLGYKIKEDQWLEVRNEFSELLSQLSETVEDDNVNVNNEKKSLEAVSQSSKTRVHYHKFTHGKDIARYKKEDLIGILGKKEEIGDSAVKDKKEFIQKGNMEEYFKSKRSKKLNTTDSSLPQEHEDTEMKPLNDNCDKLNKKNSYSNDASGISIYPNKKKSKISIAFNETGEERIVEPTVEEVMKKENTEKKKSKKIVLKNVRFTESVLHTNEHSNSEKVVDNCINEPIDILVNDNSPQNDNVEIMTEFTKKSKRKRKRSFQCSEMNQINEGSKLKECPANIDITILDNMNSCPKKKKSKSKIFNIPDHDIESSETSNKTATDFLENRQINTDEAERKKKRKHESSLTESNPELTKKFPKSYFNSDATKSANLPSELIYDSSSKKKNKREKYNFEESKNIQEDSSDPATHNLTDLMKSVVDYNSANNVEDYIKQFEKNREELLNKYREKYKAKYSLLPSDNIEVFGDEFDGRKLDCKKPLIEEKLTVKDLQKRNMSKAERIVAKARLLKNIKDNIVTHDFKGSNLATIAGYGGVIC